MAAAACGAQSNIWLPPTDRRCAAVSHTRRLLTNGTHTYKLGGASVACTRVACSKLAGSVLAQACIPPPPAQGACTCGQAGHNTYTHAPRAAGHLHWGITAAQQTAGWACSGTDAQTKAAREALEMEINRALQVGSLPCGAACVHNLHVHASPHQAEHCCDACAALWRDEQGGAHRT